MKKIQILSAVVLFITLVIMGINVFLTSFPDWIARINGVVMLIGIFTISYSTAKRRKEK